MTTGRINQVTVLRARPAEGPHEAAGTRAFARSPARVSHRPIKSSPVPQGPRRTSLSGASEPKPHGHEFLVPRSHTPQVRSPGPSDWGRPLR
jgi:hypothetical protein